VQRSLRHNMIVAANRASPAPRIEASAQETIRRTTPCNFLRRIPFPSPFSLPCHSSPQLHMLPDRL
jgi:hypothetical protein